MSTKKNAGVVTAYGAAVQAGYEGSYEDFCAAMADLGIQVGYLKNMTVTVNILTPSSSASASYANGVLTLNIPRGNKGDKGNTGETPNLTIGTVTTGEPGSSAAATITGTAENPVLNLTIPEGEKGDTGNPGEVPAAAIAGTQASTTASKALAVGEHFWLNGTLYTATSPIASGGTIVTTGSGKNCELAVIGDELASQSEKIDAEQEITETLFSVGKNKLDINALTPNKYASVPSGTPKSYSGWSLSDYIPMTKDDTYYTVIENSEGTGFKTVTGQSLYVGYYDKDGSALVGMAGSPIEYNNANLAFVRVSMATGNFSKHAMVIDAKTYAELDKTTLDGYEAYDKSLYPIVPAIKELKEAQKLQDRTTEVLSIGKNLIGNNPGVYYPVFIPAASKVTWSYEDGSNLVANDFTLYFYNKNKEQITYWGSSGSGPIPSRTVEVSATVDTYYIRLSTAPPKNLQVELGSVATTYEEYFPNAKMLSVLDDQEYAIKLANAKRKANSNAYSELTSPDIFAIAHFSDIHGNIFAMKEIRKFLYKYSASLDDTICTGDIVYDKYSDGIAFWNNHSNGNILLCIGNHDSFNGDWSTPVSQENLYNTFISPYAENWGAETVTNHTYWYKDYSAKKIRLIAIDATIFDSTEQAAQITWLENALSGAITNDYSVIGAIHFPPMPSNFQKIDSNFSALLHGTASDMNKFAWNAYCTSILGAVDQFIQNNGKFVCWLAGHTHWDQICYDSDYPEQLFINISCVMPAGEFEERARQSANKSGLLLNTVCIDTVRKYIKLLRYGAEWDDCLRHTGTCVINYGTTPPSVVFQN